MGSPDISNLTPLAEALGITVDELLKGSEDEVTGQKGAMVEQKAEQGRQKLNRAIVILAACIGAVLGILAYNFGWLG